MPDIFLNSLKLFLKYFHIFLSEQNVTDFIKCLSPWTVRSRWCLYKYLEGWVALCGPVIFVG